MIKILPQGSTIINRYRAVDNDDNLAMMEIDSKLQSSDVEKDSIFD